MRPHLPLTLEGTQEESHGVIQSLLDSSLLITASPQISEQGGSDHILFSSIRSGSVIH